MWPPAATIRPMASPCASAITTRFCPLVRVIAPTPMKTRVKTPRNSTISAASSPRLVIAIALEDFAAERARLEAAGLRVETAEHTWVHWRSLYVNDPEGNRVELVCYDPS